MEDTHWASVYTLYDDAPRSVLILVLMEDTHWVAGDVESLTFKGS